VDVKEAISLASLRLNRGEWRAKARTAMTSIHERMRERL
jgi:hypothetical protein